MPTVKWDQFDQTDATQGRDGWTATRGAIVSELSSTGLSQILEAVNALGVAIGQPHPILPGCSLDSIAPRHESPSVVRCMLNYKSLDASELPLGAGGGGGPEAGEDGYTIEVGGSLVQKETNKDRDGMLLHAYRIGAGVGPDDPESYIATVPVLRPQVTISISRREPTNPMAKAKAYVGTAGAAGWKLDPTAGVNTWLCTGISGTSTDGGKTFDVRHDFQYDPDTWTIRIYWHDKATGEIPAGEPGREVFLYKIKNFNTFGF